MAATAKDCLLTLCADLGVRTRAEFGLDTEFGLDERTLCGRIGLESGVKGLERGLLADRGVPGFDGDDSTLPEVLGLTYKKGNIIHKRTACTMMGG